MTLDELINLEAIKQLKYRYIRSLDLKQYEDFRACFAEDARWVSNGGTVDFQGRDTIVEWVKAATEAETQLCHHVVTQPEIAFTSDHTATGTWKLDSTVVLTDQDLTIWAGAFYFDEYVKVDGAWKIKLTGHKAIFEECYARSDIKSLRISANWWETGGVSDLTTAEAGVPGAGE
jgi:uncharacterized protein (TIGR02246 family)